MIILLRKDYITSMFIMKLLNMRINYLLIFLFLLLVSPLIVFSQTINSADEVEERMPEFPGGNNAMFQFLGDNVKYPSKAKSKIIEGKVMVNFTIGSDGIIRDVKAVNKVHKLLAAEAVRVVEAMPKWVSGVQRGEAVSVSYNLPINFKLSKEEKKKLKKE